MVGYDENQARFYVDDTAVAPRRLAVAKRRKAASGLISSAVAASILMLVVAGIYGFATRQSPWPLFMMAELPGAAVAFILLAVTSPR